MLDGKVPPGPIEQKWDKCRFDMKLVNPANKRKHSVIVVGSGLAGASAAATLGELGYRVHCFCYQDSPRRAHSIAAQGGINAAKNYQNDGDSVYRLFYDTIKGGDFRSREANVYRLAAGQRQHHRPVRGAGRPVRPRVRRDCWRTGRSAAPRSRARSTPAGQTGQQLLLGAYQALERQVGARQRGDVPPRTRCWSWWSSTAGPAASSTRDLETGKIESFAADAVILATGGYGNVFYLSTNAKGCNTTAIWRAHKQGRGVRQPVLHPDPPDLHPRHRRAPDQADADVRVAPQRRPHLGAQEEGRHPPARRRSPRTSATTYLERKYPSFGNLVPARHRLARRQAGLRRGPRRRQDRAAASTSTSPTRSSGSASTRSARRYGNLFEMYERITDEDPYQVPMRIYPAVHYTMGGLWVDYNLMSTIPGLFVCGEANFSDHGANRLGASALMQGLADGYFILPYTLGNYLAPTQAGEGLDRPPRVQGGRGGVHARLKSSWASRAGGRSTRSTARWARSCGTTAAWRATKQSLQDGPGEDPRAARGVLAGRLASSATATSSISRSRRPAASPTSSSWASSLSRRPGAHGVVRRPLPRGEPDAGRRGRSRR